MKKTLTRLFWVLLAIWSVGWLAWAGYDTYQTQQYIREIKADISEKQEYLDQKLWKIPHDVRSKRPTSNALTLADEMGCEILVAYQWTSYYDLYPRDLVELQKLNDEAQQARPGVLCVFTINVSPTDTDWAIRDILKEHGISLMTVAGGSVGDRGDPGLLAAFGKVQGEWVCLGGFLTTEVRCPFALHDVVQPVIMELLEGWPQIPERFKPHLSPVDNRFDL